MACWRKLENGVLVGELRNTRLGQKLEAEGDYVLLVEPSGLQPQGAALVGAAVDVAGHSASVQMWGGVLGARTNIGSVLTPTNGSPTMLPDEISLTGMRGVTISSLVGGVLVEVSQ